MKVAPTLQSNMSNSEVKDTRAYGHEFLSIQSYTPSYNGESRESTAQNFPLHSLEPVYGAIAFYFANRQLVDVYLKLQQFCREKNPWLYQIVDFKP